MSRIVSPVSNDFGERIVRNLRALQLDDELDFPDIDANSFDIKDSVHKQAQRIRKAEWLLYQLFTSWDPSIAKVLEPYYPAYDAKQSQDLRTALFQQLGTLKRDGVFPKELILRKTMFDDCKGPKFEELLAAFSTSVLLKVLDRDLSDRSITKNLILSEKNTEVGDLQLLESVYRWRLAKTLNDRADLTRRWHRFGRVLKVKEDEIRQRRREHELTSEQSRTSRIPKRRLDRVAAHVQRDWNTSNEWTSILFKGDHHLPDKSLLERPYDEVWQHASQDTLYHFRPEKTVSALQRLEQHIDKQNTRLAKWREAKNMLDHVGTPTKPATPRGRASTDRSISPELGTTPYEEASRHSSRKLNQEATPPRPTTARQKTLTNDSPPTPMRDGFRRMKLIDGTPPRKSSRDAFHDEQPEHEHRLDTAATEKAFRRRSNTVLYSPQPSLGSKSSMDRLNEGYESPTGYFDDSLDVDDDATRIINSVLQAAPSPAKPLRPLSLTERTRMSMAIQPENAWPATVRPRSTSPLKQGSPIQSTTRPLPVTLDERTRQSLSFLSTNVPPPSSVDPSPSSSRPGTARRINSSGRSSRSPEKRNRLRQQEQSDLVEVDETLLSENVDEDTIFMSRPKIAFSPPLSPVRTHDDFPAMQFRDDISVEDFS